MALTRGKKAKGGGDHGIAWTDPRRFERQPQGIGARGAANGMGHPAFFRGGTLKLRHLGAHDEILRGKDGFYGLEQQRPDGAIFTRKVQAWHPQRAGGLLAVSHVGNGSTATSRRHIAHGMHLMHQD